ncbi:hypothetical protein [Dethiosulfatarculus sandiegensis]|uniref:hypothetical protein n=1 Tax=Dethiosulfatarculus sandiegensis TaxID=1429043 RepID=UPI0018D0413C|nr:hypothetical protein [Dethiosulfatarculus sandiegensis]
MATLLDSNKGLIPMSLFTLYDYLKKPEKNGSKIGWFRIVCATFGGLLLAYSGMTLLVFLIPDKVQLAVFLPFLFTPLVWSCAALWISVSPSKLSTLLRFVVPTLCFNAGIIYFVCMD